MYRANYSWLVPALIGLVVGGAGIATLEWGGTSLQRIQIAASDLLMLRAGGPQLGRQPTEAPIVLVQYDRRSADRLKALPAHDQDLALYRALLAAGARSVIDTRMIADASPLETSTVKSLLDAMLKIDAHGKLRRDVWVPGNWPREQLDRYRPLIAHNILNMHPHVDSALEARRYPLAVLESTDFYDTLPLIAAHFRERPDQSAFPTLQAAGILDYWATVFPRDKKLPTWMRGEKLVEPADYRSSQNGIHIPWQPIDSNSLLVPPAGFWINYALVPNSWERLSYVDASDPAVNAKVADKIVLIGFEATVDPTADNYDTPLSTARWPAVEVVAAAVQTLLERKFMRPPSTAAADITVIFLALVTGLAGGKLRPFPGAAVVVGAVLVYLASAAIAYRHGTPIDVAVTPTVGLVAGVLGAAYRYTGEVRAKSRIVDLFGRYVPKAVVTQLIQQREAESLALGGINRDVTVLFADVRGFTTYAERVPPDEVLRQLNGLLKVMVDCTFQNEGTVDKFIGDAILVLFNAPLDQPDHVLRAVRTAWGIQQGLKDHPSGLAVGIGIHRGVAVVGRVGTPERMEYTAIGSTVNLASRLCGAAPSGKIIVSAEVAGAIGDEFVLEPQSPIHVKGVEGTLSTSIVTGPRVGQEK